MTITGDFPVAKPRLLTVDRILALITVLLTVALAVYLVTFTQAQRVENECQNRVDAEFRESVSGPRSAASAAERAAQAEVFNALAATPVDQSRVREAAQRAVQAKDAADAVRNANPLPVGTTTCN